MRTILEHTEKFHATMDLHSCGHAKGSLDNTIAEYDDLILTIESPPVTAHDRELIKQFENDRQPYLDAVAKLNKRLKGPVKKKNDHSR